MITTIKQQFNECNSITLINGRSQRNKHQKSNLLLFWHDMIDIRNFHSNLLKIDKKLHKGIDIYYIGYITIKKFGDCENIHSVNPLYLIIHSATGHFKEKYGEKYLIIDSTEKYEEVFSGVKSEIEALNGNKELFYGKKYTNVHPQVKFAIQDVVLRVSKRKKSKVFPRGAFFLIFW